MTCFRPLLAYQTDDGKIVFSDRRAEWRELQLPCGSCDGCRLERSRQWAVRCMHELQLHDRSAFITLTYDNAHLPENGSLRHRDWQLFAKRVRKELGSFRFLMCGEYGGLLGRPHYHAIMFGVDFPDRTFLKTTPAGSKLYRSPILERLWPAGNSSIGDVTFESCAYVARYSLKKLGNDVERLGTVDFSTGAIDLKRPEYARMSLRPAIARDWWSKYSGDVKRRGDVVANGVSMKPPRYYDKLLEAEDGFRLDEMKYDRFLKVRPEDGTPERLRVQEIVTKAGISFKRRDL